MQASATSVEQAPAAAEEPPTRGTRIGGPLAWLVWGLGALCYFTALFHRASLGVAAPDALSRFSAGPALLSVFSALQLGVYLALQVPSGVLADRLGPRRVITAGMIAMTAGSAIFGLATSPWGGIFGRVLIGVGDAFMFTNVLRLAAHWFPAGHFGRIAALTGLAGGVGQVVSTVPLTASLHGAGWVPTFLGAAAMTLAFGVLAYTVIRDRPARRNDPGEHEMADPGERVGHALRAVVAQHGTRHAFWVHFVLMAQFVALTTLWGPPWLTEAQGWSKADAGTLVMVCVLGFIAGTWFCGQFLAGRPRRRDRGTLVLSLGVLVSWLLMIAVPGSLPTPLLGLVLVVIGVGGGAGMLAFDEVRASNPAHRSGTASGVVNMGGFSGAVLIQLGVGAILQLAGNAAASTAYRYAFLPVAVLVAIGTLAQLRPRSARDR